MGHSECIWVDSDVLLDWLCARQPWDVPATELIERGAAGEWSLCFSPLTLANIFYLYRKYAGLAQAQRAVLTLEALGVIAPMSATHVRRALASGRADFEDEIQRSCAEAVGGLSAIVTRNIADYSHSNLPVRTPADWLAIRPKTSSL